MKYFRIFLLSSQEVLVQRSRSFVWFLITLVESSLLLLFWLAALQTNTIVGFSVSIAISYYLILAVLSVIVTSHIEDEVAYEQIRDGKLTNFLLKPISYFGMNLLQEIPYRLLQGFYGILLLSVLLIFFGRFFQLVTDPFKIFLAIIITFLAYFLFFTYKMIISLFAFWIVDIGGFMQVQEIILTICAGYMLPLHLYPSQLQGFLLSLPFAYMIYYPVIAFQGTLSIFSLMKIIGIQIVWFFVFFCIFQILWKNGVKKYTAIGQ